MNRTEALSRLEGECDLLVIGGGATGLGVAVDSASRGYRTTLVTADDFAQATSSRSTKLIHGGVRYLEKGDIKLVREALHERGLLLRNAPHLVHDLRFLIPAYHWWQLGYYGAGLKAYDVLAGGLNLTPSGPVRRQRALTMVPTIRVQGLKGGVVYSDGQFNDSRLAIALARTAHARGAVVANYSQVVRLVKDGSRAAGAVVRDQLDGSERTIRARAMVNATGIFTDQLRQMDDPTSTPILSHSRGTHIVLERSFLPGNAAILVPKTDDGRVVFIIPWEGHTLVGTTDIPVDAAELEPEPTEEEIQFLLHYAGLYLSKTPVRGDVLGAYAGLRPLVRGNTATTSQLSRDHTLLVSDSGLVTITGGKWTTYRRMAQDAVTRAATIGGLEPHPCITDRLPLSGAESADARWKQLGASGQEVFRYEADYPGLLHPDLPYSFAMAAYVIDQEMPVHLDDVLSRRLRALLLNTRAAVAVAPAVAELMARKQNRDSTWVSTEVERFRSLAVRYGLREAAGAPVIA